MEGTAGSIKEFAEKVRSGKADPVSHTKKVLDELKKTDMDYHYFNLISEELALEQAERVRENPAGKLAGVPVSAKDCILVKGIESTAGSRILEGYKPLFNATAVQKCIDEGAIIIGKTAQDEFGFGGFSANTGQGFRTPLNPFDKERACGGSSGGSGGITKKASFPHFSLGESTGGSIVNPASFCGVYGLCPTYGRVSRNGLIDYGNSLDKIGPMARSMEDAAYALEIISGHDSSDSTSLNKPVEEYSSHAGKGVKGMKIGIIKEAFGEGVDEGIKDAVRKGIGSLEKKGAECEEISLPITSKHGLSAYYIISASEASTNLARYCGMRYGRHEKLEGSFSDYFRKVRSSNLGREAKRRIIIGTFARMAGFRDAYYMKAMRIRTKVIEEYKKAFSKYDVLASPTVPAAAPRFDEIKKMSLLQSYMFDKLTVGPNLAGLPHINVPAGFEKKDGKDLPVGMMLVAGHLQESKLARAGGVFGE